MTREAKLLILPGLLLLAFFLVDKLFLLRTVRIHTQKDPTSLYYEYKYELLEKLALEFSPESARERKEAAERAKESGQIARPHRALVVIGSSRLLFFDYDTFRRNHPEWEVYNFSVPVNSPAYYAYILERIYESGVRPDYLILESDPFQFNEFSPGFRRSNLQYSFDLRFILSNFDRFDRDDVSAFLGRWLFAGMKYPPHPDRLSMLINGNDRLLPLFIETDRYTRETNGCGFSPIPVPGWFEKDFATLAISSEGTKGWLYGNYTESETQWSFFESALALAREHETPLLVIRPQVSRPMQRQLEEDERIAFYTESWRKRLDKARARAPFLDLSAGEPFYCNAFVDGAHMAMECYDPVLDEAMKRYTEARDGASANHR